MPYSCVWKVQTGTGHRVHVCVYLDALLAEEVRSGVQDVCSMCGVVVGVRGVVIGLYDLQPGTQRRLRTAQELANSKPRENLQPQIRQRPVRKTTELLYVKQRQQKAAD